MVPDEVKSLKAVGLQNYCIKAKVGKDKLIKVVFLIFGCETVVNIV